MKILFVFIVLLTPSDNGTSVVCSDKSDEDRLYPFETVSNFPFEGRCFTTDLTSSLALSTGCDRLFSEWRNESFVVFISVAFVGENDDNTEGIICADNFELDILIVEREMGFCLDFSCARQVVVLFGDIWVSAWDT